jgi:hypothetical protein
MANRFDLTVEHFANRGSRRQAIGVVLAALAGSLLPKAGSGRTIAGITCDAQSVIFSDDFESGDLRKWDSPHGLVVQSTNRYSGQYAVKAAGSTPQFARTGLGGGYRDLYVRLMFNASRIPPHDWVYLTTLRDTSDAPVIGFAITADRRLVYRNNIVNDPTIKVPGVQSSTLVSRNEWHEIQAHVRIDGSDSLVEVWFDGEAVDDMRNTEQLGTAPIARLQFGESLPDRTFDVTFDELVVATAYCGSSQSDSNGSAPPSEPQSGPLTCPGEFEPVGTECCDENSCYTP